MSEYGLIWDEEKNPEAIVEKTEKSIPYVEEVPGQSIKGTNTQHILINGDNYPALKILNQSHKNSIDVICIDPPYNTGNAFIYHDNRTNKGDNYRSSEWLNFMKKRIDLAYDLLKDDGIFYCFIGDDELANLTLLCDQKFTRENRISIISRVQKLGGGKATHFSPACDFVLMYAKNIEAIDEIGLNRSDVEVEKRGFINPLPPSKNQVYDITFSCGTKVSPPEGKGWLLAYDSFVKEFILFINVFLYFLVLFLYNFVLK